MLIFFFTLSPDLPVKKELISAACVGPKETISIQYPFKTLVSGTVFFYFFIFFLPTFPKT